MVVKFLPVSHVQDPLIYSVTTLVQNINAPFHKSDSHCLSLAWHQNSLSAENSMPNCKSLIDFVNDLDSSDPIRVSKLAQSKEEVGFKLFLRETLFAGSSCRHFEQYNWMAIRSIRHGI